jgi:predicted amino acid dehydrogenase
VELDGTGDQAGSGVCGAAGGVAQAGRTVLIGALRSGRWRMIQRGMSARNKARTVAVS